MSLDRAISECNKNSHEQLQQEVDNRKEHFPIEAGHHVVTENTQSTSHQFGNKSNSRNSTSRNPHQSENRDHHHTSIKSRRLLLEQIFESLNNLEYTLIDDQRYDFKLKLALERQTEQVQYLNSSLESEKLRNHRLMELIRNEDSASSADDEFNNIVSKYIHQGINTPSWQSRSSMDTYESISPLLMQQRYEELSSSHKRCQRQLMKKEKLLKTVKCENEILQSKYEELFHEYCKMQKRLEELCQIYLRLQTKKKQEVQKLRDALINASDCVLSASQVIDLRNPINRKFGQNLKLFINALGLCGRMQTT